MRNNLALSLLSAACIAWPAHAAPAASDGVRVSTDPARAAEVERHAGELKARAGSVSPILARGWTLAGAAFVSGGITVEDRLRLHAERQRYTLWVATVAKPSGAYLADAKLKIVNVKNSQVVAERRMEGPWYLIDLPAGTYRVFVVYRDDGSSLDQTQTATVHVDKGVLRQAVLRFDSSASVSPEMESPFDGNPFGATRRP